jgi:hypothetical protein
MAKGGKKLPALSDVLKGVRLKPQQPKTRRFWWSNTEDEDPGTDTVYPGFLLLTDKERARAAGNLFKLANTYSQNDSFVDLSIMRELLVGANQLMGTRGFQTLGEIQPSEDAEFHNELELEPLTEGGGGGPPITLIRLRSTLKVPAGLGGGGFDPSNLKFQIKPYEDGDIFRIMQMSTDNGEHWSDTGYGWRFKDGPGALLMRRVPYDTLAKLQYSDDGGESWTNTDYGFPAPIKWPFVGSIKNELGESLGTVQFVDIENPFDHDIERFNLEIVMNGSGGGGGFPGWGVIQAHPVTPISDMAVDVELNPDTGHYDMDFYINRAPIFFQDESIIGTPGVDDPALTVTRDTNGDYRMQAKVVAGKDGRDLTLTPLDPPTAGTTTHYRIRVPASGIILPFLLPANYTISNIVDNSTKWSAVILTGIPPTQATNRFIAGRAGVFDSDYAEGPIGELVCLLHPASGVGTNLTEIQTDADIVSEADRYVQFRMGNSAYPGAGEDFYGEGELIIDFDIIDSTPHPLIMDGLPNQSDDPGGTAGVSETSPGNWYFSYSNPLDHPTTVVFFFHRDNVISSSPQDPGSVPVRITSLSADTSTIASPDTSGSVTTYPAAGGFTQEVASWFDDVTLPIDLYGFRVVVKDGETFSGNLSFTEIP